MLFYNNFFDNLIILVSYIFIYNLSLFILFWIFFNFISFNFKTLYSFNDLKFNFYFLSLITLILFSIAGVPPFIGFFSKILILISLLNSNFFFFYILFFSLIFFGLYFYLQNIRFLYSNSNKTINYSFIFNLKLSTIFLSITFFLSFFFIFGIFFFDEIIFYLNWIFI